MAITLTPPNPITLRYHVVRSNQPITLRFEVDSQRSHQTITSGLQVGSIFAGRYRVQHGPLSPSGEADVFQCIDEQNSNLVAVKIYRHQARPKEKIIRHLQGLAHPNIITIVDYGTWQGCFYEVSSYCAGGVASDHMPMGEINLRQYLPGILAGLQYLHGEGIVHRDLKPSNLFFADSMRQTMMLGDFGISSYLEIATQAVRITDTAAQMTLDYAAPELLNHHEVGPATDYYALGISLLHLINGQSPFQGMRNNDILVAHLRAKIPMPTSLSEPFQLLIAGLTHAQSEHRWGYHELMRWLHGEEVRLAPSRPMATKGEPSYPGYPDAKSPAELARHIDDIDALKQLLRGDIQRWVFDHFDIDLAERIADLEMQAVENSSRAVASLPFILDPHAPLQIDGTCIDNIAELVTLLRESAVKLKDAWQHDAIDAWLREGSRAGARTQELLARLQDLHERLPHNPDLALFALLNTLDTSLPLPLVGLGEISHTSELKALFKKSNRTLIRVLGTVIFNQELEEWLQAKGSDGWQRHIQFLRKIRVQYTRQPDVGAYCVLWHFCPDIPFPFDGKNFSHASELALHIDQSKNAHSKALIYLQRGWISAWLQGSGKVEASVEFNDLLLNAGLSEEVRLETLLRLMEPSLASPQIILQPEFLKFGSLQQGEQKSRILRIRSNGRGWLHGVIELQHFGDGIMLDSFDFEGEVSDIHLKLDTASLTPGQYENLLTIRSNAGNHEIKISYQIIEKPLSPWWQQWPQ